ncbi:MAG TPA: hypothetical protein VGG72_11930 [Bryobacteraceae bacterium]
MRVVGILFLFAGMLATVRAATPPLTGTPIIFPGGPVRIDTPAGAPEIDAGSAASALTLLSGSLLVLRSRRQKVVSPAREV